MKRALAFAPLAALLVIVAVAAFLLMRPGERETFTTGDDLRPVPTYALTRLGGGDLVTSDAMAGRAHLINVYASWCTPCRAEHPQLMALNAAGVEIVGISYKDQPAHSQRFLDELGNPFSAIGVDPEGRFGIELGIMAVPETFVIGPDGRIRYIHRGPLTPDVVQSTILPALQAP